MAFTDEYLAYKNLTLPVSPDEQYMGPQVYNRLPRETIPRVYPQIPTEFPPPDIGPGGVMMQQPEVQSFDLPPGGEPDLAARDRFRQQFYRQAFGSAPGDLRPPVDQNIPMALAPASRRFNASTRPEFIYTNPVAAQQAASNLQARLGFEANQDQGYRDYLARLSQTQATNQLAQSQQATRLGENERDRQLQRDINAGNIQSRREQNTFNENARRAELEAAQRARTNELARADWQKKRQAHDVGQAMADRLNMPGGATPAALQQAKDFTTIDPGTGKYVPLFKDPGEFIELSAPAAPVAPGQPGQSIEEIRARIQAANNPGRSAVGLPTRPAPIIPSFAGGVPSRGAFLRAPVLQGQ